MAFFFFFEWSPGGSESPPEFFSFIVAYEALQPLRPNEPEFTGGTGGDKRENTHTPTNYNS
jgi:hypothetical protein